MTKSWILAANSSEAHLYSVDRVKLLNGHASPLLLKDYSHADSRKKTSDLIINNKGHFHNRQHFSGAFDPHTDPKEVEEDFFAREIAQTLEEGRQNHQFEDLIIIASPDFHGKLNKHLKQNHLDEMVSVTVDKDYTRLPMKKLLSRLQVYL